MRLTENLQASAILDGLLWSGPHQTVVTPDYLTRLVAQGLECIISILPVGNPGFPVDRIRPIPNAHRILTCMDDETVDPQRIHWLIDLPVPTLIHCNAGQNRSSMVAACWIIHHRGMDADTALMKVIAKRSAVLGHEPRITPVMRENVHAYAKWFQAESA